MLALIIIIFNLMILGASLPRILQNLNVKGRKSRRRLLLLMEAVPVWVPEWPIILNSNAHIFWPKGAQKCAHPNFSKKRTNAHIFWPKGAQKCAHQKFWLKVHNSISRLKNVFF